MYMYVYIHYRNGYIASMFIYLTILIVFLSLCLSVYLSVSLSLRWQNPGESFGMNVSGGIGSEGGDLPVFISVVRPNSPVDKCRKIQVSNKEIWFTVPLNKAFLYCICSTHYTTHAFTQGVRLLCCKHSPCCFSTTWLFCIYGYHRRLSIQQSKLEAWIVWNVKVIQVSRLPKR